MFADYSCESVESDTSRVSCSHRNTAYPSGVIFKFMIKCDVCDSYIWKIWSAIQCLDCNRYLHQTCSSSNNGQLTANLKTDTVTSKLTEYISAEDFCGRQWSENDYDDDDDDDDGYKDCEKFFRMQTNEITNELQRSLKLTAARDQSLVRLLRAKVDQRTGRDERRTRVALDVLAEIRGEMEENNEHLDVVKKRVRGQLDQFVDNLSAGRGDEGSSRDGHDFDDRVLATIANLTASNVHFVEILRKEQQVLDDVLSDVRSVEKQIQQLLEENDSMKKRAATMIGDTDEHRSSNQPTAESMSELISNWECDESSDND